MNMCFGFGCFGGWGGAGFGWMWSMPILWLAFWIFIIWIIVQAIRPQAKQSDEDSLKILKRRYAKGQISKKEYLQMKKELEED